MVEKASVKNSFDDVNDPLMSSGYYQQGSALTMGPGGDDRSRCYGGYKIDADGNIVTGEKKPATLGEKLKHTIIKPILEKLGL